jgi:hypothetical protein
MGRKHRAIVGQQQPASHHSTTRTEKVASMDSAYSLRSKPTSSRTRTMNHLTPGVVVRWCGCWCSAPLPCQPEGPLLELGATGRATSTRSSRSSSGIGRWPNTTSMETKRTRAMKHTNHQEDQSHEAHKLRFASLQFEDTNYSLLP